MDRRLNWKTKPVTIIRMKLILRHGIGERKKENYEKCFKKGGKNEWRSVVASVKAIMSQNFVASEERREIESWSLLQLKDKGKENQNLSKLFTFRTLYVTLRSNRF